MLASADGSERGGLPVVTYRQGRALYYGGEVETSAALASIGAMTLRADVTADIVRARLLGGGGNVPRIPPLRVRAGLELASAALSLRGEVERSAAQRRVSPFETPTAGFTLVNLAVQWQPFGKAGGVSMLLAADNVFDVVARRHASFTKDFAPLAGRDLRATLRVSF